MVDDDLFIVMFQAPIEISDFHINLWIQKKNNNSQQSLK